MKKIVAISAIAMLAAACDQLGLEMPTGTEPAATAAAEVGDTAAPATEEPLAEAPTQTGPAPLNIENPTVTQIEGRWWKIVRGDEVEFHHFHQRPRQEGILDHGMNTVITTDGGERENLYHNVNNCESKTPDANGSALAYNGRNRTCISFSRVVDNRLLANDTGHDLEYTLATPEEVAQLKPSRQLPLVDNQ